VPTRSPALPIFDVPNPIYRDCTLNPNWPPEIGFTTISLVYGTTSPLFAFRLVGETGTDYLTDSLAFGIIIYLALKSGTYRSKLPSLLKVMAGDAMFYFLVIFTSHLLLEMTLIFGTVRTFHITLFSLSRTETFVAFDQTTPWSVSNVATYLFRSFAELFSTG